MITCKHITFGQRRAGKLCAATNLKPKNMRKILTLLFALVSVVTMGQEVKVDTVVTDLVTTDTVKADTYVEQEGKFY